MAFTATQVRQLKAKLDPKHVKTRTLGGVTLHYVEGWHVVAEANRIFGFEGWDRETLSIACVSNTKERGEYVVAYTTKVRVTVRAGDTLVMREGSGTGEAKSLSPGQAHDLALKSAETDATKRALASFGNVFGLALYDREQWGVKKPPKPEINTSDDAWAFRSAKGEVLSVFETPKEFADALQSALKSSTNVDELYAIWEQNVTTVRLLHSLFRRYRGTYGVNGLQLATLLKHCARRLATAGKARGSEAQPQAQSSRSLPVKIDKSVLVISEPKRIRSREHLRFVGEQPCLICGRTPSHAHHVRFAQPRGLALKVSDEFTVPLCVIHNSENHATGDERRWWQERKIDPLPVAERLWRESCRAAPTVE
jgi:DNA recombination protein Rad52